MIFWNFKTFLGDQRYNDEGVFSFVSLGLITSIEIKKQITLLVQTKDTSQTKLEIKLNSLKPEIPPQRSLKGDGKKPHFLCSNPQNSTYNSSFIVDAISKIGQRNQLIKCWIWKKKNSPPFHSFHS